MGFFGFPQKKNKILFLYKKNKKKQAGCFFLRKPVCFSTLLATILFPQPTGYQLSLVNAK